MISRKRRFFRRVRLALTLIAGGAFWLGACMPVGDDGGSSNGDSTNGNSSSGTGGDSSGSGDSASIAVTMSECQMLDDEGNDYETNLAATTESGQQLTYSRRVTTSPDQNNGFMVETTVMADGELVMSVITNSDGDGGLDVQVQYGAMASGLTAANIVVENGMISGKINDRDIVEMPLDSADASQTAFMDGASAPQSGLDPELESALAKLFEEAQQTSDACQQVAADAGSESEANTALQAKFPPQDSGKNSDPESTGACIGCWAGCSAGAVGCIAGVSAGCAASLIFYAVCEAIGLGSCAIAYTVCVGACNIEGAPCCPVGCGDVACCESGETCLNFDIGLCCAPGKTPCVGENCCATTEVCINTGPNAGICCQPEGICGNTCCDFAAGETCIEDISLCCPAEEERCDDKCCPEGETCLGDGLCCEPQNACGDACCDELDSCIESLSLCCGFNEPACNDKCCDSGQQCINGNTCCDIGRVCGPNDSVCCPAGNSCDPNTLECVGCPNPTDTPCAVGGCCPVGLNCTDVQGECCPQGETFCNGACRPISQCLS